MDIESTIKSKFYSLFTSQPQFFKAPGRINLIGEHTDYNDGFVLPGAIDFSIQFAIGTNNDNVYRFYSIDFDSIFTANDVHTDVGNNLWASYLIGVIAQFKNAGFDPGGIDCVFGGNIPLGAGLSSSAALESGFAIGINSICNYDIPPLQLARMAQKAEHEFAGVMCGIMDQFASVFGRKDHVFRLDCRTLDFSYFPLDMKYHSLVLVDTKVKHSLASSEYNTRRKECNEGVEILKKKFPNIKALRDTSIEQLESVSEMMPDTVYKRCLYVVNENLRVLEACHALETSNFNSFGELMYQSHEGLQNDYEVSCMELDLLVDATRKMDFVLGSRMMGGGFGGCTINLIEKGFEERFQKEITQFYLDKTGITAEVFKVNLSDGAGKAHV